MLENCDKLTVVYAFYPPKKTQVLDYHRHVRNHTSQAKTTATCNSRPLPPSARHVQLPKKACGLTKIRSPIGVRVTNVYICWVAAVRILTSPFTNWHSRINSNRSYSTKTWCCVVGKLIIIQVRMEGENLRGWRQIKVQCTLHGYNGHIVMEAFRHFACYVTSVALVSLWIQLKPLFTAS